MGSRALRQRLGDVRGIGLAVGRQVGRPHQVRGVHEGPEVRSLLGAEQMHFQPEAVRRRGLALDLGPAFLVVGEAKAPVLLPAGGETGLGLEGTIELDAVLQQLGDAGART